MNEPKPLTDKEKALICQIMIEQQGLKEQEKALVLDQLGNELDERFEEWKKFTFQDRTLDTIIAFTLGMAFSKLATAFSESLIMPFLKFAIKFTGNSWREIVWTPFANLSFEIGKFLAASFDFILMSVVLFVMWKTVKWFAKRKEDEQNEQNAQSSSSQSSSSQSSSSHRRHKTQRRKK